MPSRSFGGEPWPPRQPTGPILDDPLQAAFDAAPATIIDPRPALAGRWRPDLLDDEGLRPSDAPTRESKDVSEALAAHECSLARAREEQAIPVEILERRPAPVLALS